MLQIETGMLAKSLAGRDKDEIYMIAKVDNDYVYLVDGRLRTYENMKKKKQKHIQVISNTIIIEETTNEVVRRRIKEYNHLRSK